METDKSQEQVLRKALDGDINAFQSLFADFQQQLKSYLYRLLANRNDAEDLTHDTFIKAFDKLHSFRGEASFKTWVFQIATHLAYNYLKRSKRWTEDVSEKAKKLVQKDAALRKEIVQVHESDQAAKYDIKEHIDTCFTCISKTLPIEKQVSIILKDVYDFTVAEICLILDKTEGVVKYLLQEARKTLSEIFDRRCALVNKNGVCHQCSELNAWLNPKQHQQEALLKLNLVKNAHKLDQEALYEMRAQLIKNIDPLRSEGADLQEILMKCNRLAMEPS